MKENLEGLILTLLKMGGAKRVPYEFFPVTSTNVPVETRTKNVRTKDVPKRTFIFGSVWKHGKTSDSECLMNVRFGMS